MSTFPVRTDTTTYDHTFFYRLREGKIERKPIASPPKQEWKEIPFPKKATRLSAGHDLLIAVDENQRVYKACRSFFSDKISWEPQALHTMAKAKAVSATVQEGENEIYMLNPSGNRILCSTNNQPFSYEILGPEGGMFAAENLSASGATLFLLQRNLGTHTMYTQNGSSEWVKQPCIPLTKEARLTKNITVLQEGNDYELRVEGTNKEGTSGYYVKKLSEKTWNFRPTYHSISRSAESTPQPQLLKEKAKGKVQIGKSTFDATLKNAPAGEFRRILEIRVPSKKTLVCPLHKKGSKWRLIAPKEAPLALRNLKVTMHKQGSQLHIEGKNFKAELKQSRTSFTAQSSLSVMGYLMVQSALWISNPMTNLLHRLESLFYYLFPSCNSQAAAQARLQESLQLKDRQDTSLVIQQLIKNDPSLAPKTVANFLGSSSVIPHLNQLMQGANARVRDSKGDRLFKAWTQCKGAKQRISSHAHLPGTSYGIEIPLFGELLFWKDAQGHLRLQFEAHSLNGLLQIYHHGIDYLLYRLSGKQQGLYGSSKHIDSIPIDL